MADEYTTPDAPVEAPVETAAPVEAPAAPVEAPAAPVATETGYNPATFSFDLPSA
jgi:hypothetical protein